MYFLSQLYRQKALSDSIASIYAKFEVTSFYAYLIGEKIDYEAFLRRNPLFEKSYYFDYVYCPDMKVYGGNRSKGSMRVEILQFSTLLKRAEMRNKVFLDQLDS